MGYIVLVIIIIAVWKWSKKSNEPKLNLDRPDVKVIVRNALIKHQSKEKAFHEALDELTKKLKIVEGTPKEDRVYSQYIQYLVDAWKQQTGELPEPKWYE